MQSIRQYRKLREIVNTGIASRSHDLYTDPKDYGSSADEKSDLDFPVPGAEVDPESHHIIVEWDGPDDPLAPRNWPMRRRLIVFAMIWINVFALDFPSSVDSQASSKIIKDFHVSAEAETLSPALYTFGIAIGSLFAGPISESVGRNPIYVISRIVHVCFLLGVALAPNFGAKCAFRFLAGLGGSTMLCIHGASTADLWNPIERTWAWPVISLASFAGTSISPTVGAWITQSSVSWRWVEWVALILSGATLPLSLFFMPETFAPVLLSWKAKHLRDATGNQNYVSYLDLQESFPKRLRTALVRAWHMLVKEPIVALMGLWLIVVYVCIYGFLQGFSSIFGDTYNLKRGLIGTCFCAIVAGFSIWMLLVPIYYRLYVRKVHQLEREGFAEGSPVKHIPGLDIPEPEYRLWPAVIVGPLLPVCLFWLGWTARPSISIWSSLAAVLVFGFCWAGIYVVVYNYILDVYGIYAGSALAVITFFRYGFSGIINVVSRPMYANLTVEWTLTLWGCIAVIMAGAPFFFFWLGPTIRLKSNFAGRYARPVYQRRGTGRALSWS